MRELDVLLERYLRERYPSAPAAEQQAFEALLDLPDPAAARLRDAAAGSGRIRTGLMSSRNSPTLTLDVRARRAERRAAWLAARRGRAARSCCSAPRRCGHSCWLPLASARSRWGLWRAGWIGSRHRIVAIRWLADGRWLLADSRGLHSPASFLPTPGWSAVPSGCAGGPRRAGARSMLLTPGDLPAEQLRALAVRLRIEALERALPEARTR